MSPFITNEQEMYTLHKGDKLGHILQMSHNRKPAAMKIKLTPKEDHLVKLQMEHRLSSLQGCIQSCLAKYLDKIETQYFFCISSWFPNAKLTGFHATEKL